MPYSTNTVVHIDEKGGNLLFAGYVEHNVSYASWLLYLSPCHIRADDVVLQRSSLIVGTVDNIVLARFYYTSHIY